MHGMGLRTGRRRRAGSAGNGVAIPLNTEILTIGDSRTANQFSASGTFLENSKWGDRLTSASRGKLVYKPAGEFGVGGDTTALILARFSAITAVASGRMAFIWAGTNDRGSANMTLAQSQTNIQSMIDQLKAAGAVNVCILAETQRFSSSALAGQQLQNHIDFHNWVLSLNQTKVIVANAWDAIADADTVDGLHPRTQGQHRVGEAFLSAVERYLPATEIIPFTSPANLLLNPTMTGTAGSKTGAATGSVADSWTMAMSATNVGTVTISASKPASGGQQVDVAGLPTGTYGSSEFRQQRTLAAMGLVVGDTIDGAVAFSIANAVNVPGVPFRIRGLQADGVTITFTNEHGDYDSSDAAAFIPNGPWSGIRRTPPIVIPALTDSIRVSVVPQLIAVDANLSVTLTYAGLRKLN